MYLPSLRSGKDYSSAKVVPVTHKVEDLFGSNSDDSRPNLVPDKGPAGPVCGKSRILWSDAGLASHLGTGVTGPPLPEQ